MELHGVDGTFDGFGARATLGLRAASIAQARSL
jgi:hypothetical protein